MDGEFERIRRGWPYRAVIWLGRLGVLAWATLIVDVSIVLVAGDSAVRGRVFLTAWLVGVASIGVGLVILRIAGIRFVRRGLEVVMDGATFQVIRRDVLGRFAR